MLEAEFLSNGHLRVIETIHSWTETRHSYWYFDLEEGLRSLHGKEGETPTACMTHSQMLWARKHYIPLAQRQKAERDANAAAFAASVRLDPLLADPDRFEKARRWATLVTASLIKDGCFDSLTREEIRNHHIVRYEELRATMRMPSDGEIAVAYLIIAGRAEREVDSNSDRTALRERQT